MSSQERILAALREARTKLEAVERDRTEPIAIVGVGCRFPRADGPEAYWSLLKNGVDAMTTVPPDRWDGDRYYDPEPGTPGKMYSLAGGFLDAVDRFDPAFFRISRREAVSLDPQQRLLLEVAWEALEHAGHAPDSLRGSQTGIFMGLSWHDYERTVVGIDPTRLDAYAGMGNTPSIAVGRIAFFLGVHGPTAQVDTACSASLTSVHLACQSLRAGECTTALAGGVNLIISPMSTVFCCAIKALSPTGRCHTFDAGADGYARGEGCGIVVLKRLRDAVSDGDDVLAVIRGSAINHDGPASGLTVPSRRAQAAVIRQALAAGRVDPLDVDYVEAHGTGTSLGDPIEIGALGDALGQKRPPDRPLHVGSVKTNFGHLEAAAGIAGLIKVVLALRHGAIPPHLGFTTPNPNIDWEQFPVTVPTGLMEWPRSPRVAGVSSFGFSGTNAHIVLEADPTENRDEPPAPAPYLLTLSARSETALTDMARRYAETLDDSSSAPRADDACFTSHVGRTHFRHRLAVVGASSPELGRTLRTFAEGGRPRTASTGAVAAGSDTPRVAFLCTGQGSQYVGMGRELSETEPVFRDALERCDALLRPRLETPLLDVLYALTDEESPLGETAYTQPALFALEYALATLWRSWGVEPSVVMGHSVGEYVAACLAGIVSLEDGLHLIAERGRLMQALPRDGAMVALLTDEATVVEALAPHTANAAIASVNGPRNVVVSGRRAAVDAVVATLIDAGIETRPLAVSHAFHSPLMDPMLDEFERVAEQVTYAPPRLRLLSNVTGAVDPDGGTSARYWRRHVREPVRFADGMTTLGQEGCEVFLEIGPQPTLLGMGRQCLPDTTGDERTRAWVPSLRRGRSDRGQLLHALGELHVQGVPIDWSAVHRDHRGRRVALPTYPFERDRFWVAQDASQMETTVMSSTMRSERHPLLGRRQHTAGLPPGTVVFETQLSPMAPTYLADHHVFGRLIPPATTYVEVALAAGARLLGTPHLVLEDVVVHQPLVLDEETPSTIQCVATPDGPTRRLQVFGLVVDDGNWTAEPSDEPRWTLLCSTTVRRSDPGLPVTDTAPERTEADPSTDEPLPVSDCYARFRAQGLDLGPRFQAIETLVRRGRHAVGTVTIPETAVAAGPDPYLLHPVVLDACGQAVASAFPPESADEIYLPVGIERLEIFGRPAGASVRFEATLRRHDAESPARSADIRLFDEQGELVAALEGATTRRARPDSLSLHQSGRAGSGIYERVWTQEPLPSEAAPQDQDSGGTWLLTGNGSEHQRLASHLDAAGQRAILIPDAASCREALARSTGSEPIQGIVHLAAPPLGRGDEPTGELILEEASRECEAVLRVLASAATSELRPPPEIWLVTRGAQSVGRPDDMAPPTLAPLWGLGATLAFEHPELRCVRVDLSPGGDPGDELHGLCEELTHRDRADQVAYRNGRRYVARIESKGRTSVGDSLAADARQLRISDYGSLDNLELRPMTRRTPGPGEVEIRVVASGLNFRDVLRALGTATGVASQRTVDSPTDMLFGFECAGTICTVGPGVQRFRVGDAVMASQTVGTIGSFVTLDANFVIPKPDTLSFPEAATIPLAYLTAYHGLMTCAAMQPGDRVLIHAAAGGVGQAALRLARLTGAHVYATCHPRKWESLQSMGLERVMSSRTLDFANQVMEATNGQGVQIVLNSLNGEFIPKSLGVLSPGGRFVELGKLGTWTEAQVRSHRADVAYFPFDVGEITEHSPQVIASTLATISSELNQGRLSPLPHRVFPVEEAVSAFRYMQQSKHVGKVVIAQTDHTTTTVADRLSPDATYLVTGGLRGLGLEVSKWLAAKGARHLVLLGRRRPTAAAGEALDGLRQSGVHVLVAQADVSSLEELTHVFDDVRSSMPPLRGVVHAAGVLDDGVLLKQTVERLRGVMAPKIAGAWNLHLMTRELPLDFFVSFSSAASLLGSRGQGNYAAANAFLDSLAHYRRQLGLAGLSVNWGPWADVGMAADLGDQHRTRLRTQGWRSIAITEGLEILGDALRDGTTQVAVLPLDWHRFLEPLASQDLPPYFDHVRPQAEVPTTVASGPHTIRDTLRNVPLDERRPLLDAYLQRQLRIVLGLDGSQPLETERPFQELGLDSLMHMELRNVLSAELGAHVSMADFVGSENISQLVDVLMTHLSLKTLSTSADSESPGSGDDIEEITL